MHSPLRSVSVATFAGVFWFLGAAAADESPERPDAAPARRPDRPQVEEERLSDEAELARVVSLVEAAKYEECAARLSHLLDPAGSRPLRQVTVVETARLYHATCLIGLGKNEQADEPLRDALRRNPEMRAPDGLLFPPRVIDRFLRLREELIGELRARSKEEIDRAQQEAAAKQKHDNDLWAHMLKLERLAREEVLIQHNSRFVAAVPLGVGQFQNGNGPLAWTFLASEVVLSAASISTAAVFSNINVQAARLQARGQPPATDVNGRLRDWHLAMTVSTYTLLGVVALGIVEAEVSFVPEVRRVRQRPLPTPAKDRAAWLIRPDLAFGPGDVRVGVTGAF